ncbi:MULTISPECIES: flavin reductase family protein [Streptomyces]|uniref:Flavin reductase n=1 Tax=Streptomyces cinereoruber TaxID=67260 RepID=A0ABX6B9U6_9ACTN|nr:MULTISPECIES: flavin reductase family protein [Streptomyces]AVH98581.1 flavin reductase [Streptomyces sp. WAC00288]MBB4160779.1 flavin reductase (DIM6/NTAB) family NADH-FMN oxidoreductase RutF [Streptomyces cinereoruber]MBY8820608.1 flavin reductase family protein [Streptomyces cinereoruber]NIH62702.1 flavin reductase (DIM6/NTAB) family NADH-FMN oxidoreductase RutF [Streptomyces cinereoruber]PVC68602.1 flavin reductase [Streptomyces sp. CS081A]
MKALDPTGAGTVLQGVEVSHGGIAHHHVWSASGRCPGAGATEEEPIAEDAFRSVFRTHPAGVAIITAMGERRPVGFTATSLASVSSAPPLVSFGVGRNASSWATVCAAEYVAVHLLAHDQRELASTFARSGADRFAPPTRWSAGPHGVPLLDGVPTTMVCRKVYDLPAGDHTVVIAQPIRAYQGDPARPLVYLDGRFGSVSR